MPGYDDFGISPLNGSTADMRHIEATLLAADVVHFTSMTQQLGDSQSLRLMRRVARLVAQQAQMRGGRLVEIRGDSFLVVQPAGAPATTLAHELHAALLEDHERHADGGVEVRMAIHSGPVIQVREHFYGLNVILPYRLLPLTRPGELAITAPALASTPACDQLLPCARRSFLPKGFSTPVEFAILAFDAGDSRPGRLHAEEMERRCAWCSKETPVGIGSHGLCRSCRDRLIGSSGRGGTAGTE